MLHFSTWTARPTTFPYNHSTYTWPNIASPFFFFNFNPPIGTLLLASVLLVHCSIFVLSNNVSPLRPTCLIQPPRNARWGYSPSPMHLWPTLRMLRFAWNLWNCIRSILDFALLRWQNGTVERDVGFKKFWRDRQNGGGDHKTFTRWGGIIYCLRWGGDSGDGTAWICGSWRTAAWLYLY